MSSCLCGGGMEEGQLELTVDGGRVVCQLMRQDQSLKGVCWSSVVHGLLRTQWTAACSQVFVAMCMHHPTPPLPKPLFLSFHKKKTSSVFLVPCLCVFPHEHGCFDINDIMSVSPMTVETCYCVCVYVFSRMHVCACAHVLGNDCQLRILTFVPVLDLTVIGLRHPLLSVGVIFASNARPHLCFIYSITREGNCSPFLSAKMSK